MEPSQEKISIVTIVIGMDRWSVSEKMYGNKLVLCTTNFEPFITDYTNFN